MLSADPEPSLLFGSYGLKRDGSRSQELSGTYRQAPERPKTAQVFQKSYYQEPIRGESVRVPSWRMKEKVSGQFI